MYETNDEFIRRTERELAKRPGRIATAAGRVFKALDKHDDYVYTDNAGYEWTYDGEWKML